ncbi:MULTISPECIES: PAS domain-containing protein [unclassified Nocardioides]|uniref:PAS domain-containing protein n=1 Tax=unclassified Nocardioides TaxID=2615069 RepID=UPI000703071E|nr:MULTISPECIES: PAS domain-containing protein [unclassified Nocardioides]KRC46446.1 PAS sensor protein [Nocardioides sp. Root79]KRC69791.1 PAS sensor protein [Nocardioides sp. Root240]
MTAANDNYERIAIALMSSGSDAIIGTDVAGDIRWWNPGAERIFGFSPDAALGKSLDIIIPEKLRDAHWRGYREVMQTGESRYGADKMLSVPALTADGRRISVEFTLALVTSADGTLIGTVAVLRDVTGTFEELKELRRAVR